MNPVRPFLFVQYLWVSGEMVTITGHSRNNADNVVCRVEYIMNHDMTKSIFLTKIQTLLSQ